MIDGKVCNAITSTASSQKCYICGASPTEINKLDQVTRRPVDTTTFNFGLSTLHAYIRFFECLLHISYRLGIRKWQVRGSENHKKMNTQKKLIQNNFRKEMGLLVDQPKPGGSGTANDGNTARRFFQDPTKSASITGIDENLIRRFSVILRAINSGFEIDRETFDQYALQTARLYVSLYDWYYMPASVHKILVHGSAIIAAAMLPIGQLSEEVQEARNKDCNNIREKYSTKCSRTATNQDLLNMLLVSSDPVISSLRQLPQRKKFSLSLEVRALLSVTSQTALDAEKSLDEDSTSSGSE